MSEEICERCGEELPTYNVSALGAAEPSYVYGRCDCPPTPKPCCPFCRQPTGTDGRCETLECFFVGQIVPVPEWRRIPSRPPSPRPNNPRKIRR